MLRSKLITGMLCFGFFHLNANIVLSIVDVQFSLSSIPNIAAELYTSVAISEAPLSFNTYAISKSNLETQYNWLAPIVVIFLSTLSSVLLFICINYKRRLARQAHLLNENRVSPVVTAGMNDLSEVEKTMILNNVSDMVLFLSPENQVVWANNHFLKAFNRKPEEVSGKPIREVIPYLSGFLGVSDKAERQKAGTLYHEYFIPDVQRVYKATVNPVFNSKSQIEGYVKTMTDITLQKHIETQLLKAKENAEESDKQKSAFLANMSHEIRTPMNAIIGFAELLELPDLSDEERKEYLRIIRSNGQHLMMLISDILVFSQIETGQLQITRTSLRIKPLLDEVFSQFGEEVRRRSNNKVKLRLVTDFAYGDEIYSDGMRLRQILYNLLTNAIKFTEKGTITIGCKGTHNQFIFFVKDTGIGIPVDKKQIVFKRYEQVDNGGEKKRSGTGLGLSICRELVYLMGGRIWVNSVEGKGSTFLFKLPG